MDMKLTVTGRWGSGKTCLLITYVYDKFPSEYVPTSFDSYAHDVSVDGKTISVGLQDTAGGVCYFNFLVHFLAITVVYCRTEHVYLKKPFMLIATLFPYLLC